MWHNPPCCLVPSVIITRRHDRRHNEAKSELTACLSATFITISHHAARVVHASVSAASGEQDPSAY